jgi:hypothetical protein
MKRQLEVTCNAKCNEKAKDDDLPSNNNDNKLTTSKTLIEAEKKARCAEFNKNYRHPMKEQQQTLQQQQQENVIVDNSNKRPTTSLTLTEA